MLVKRLVVCAVLATASLEVVVSEASAQEEEDPARVLARDQFSEGVTLMAAEDWASALAKFKAAGRYKMSAQVAFNIAECERNLGKFVSALGNYRLAVSKADVAGAEAVRELAPQRVDALLPRIPKLAVKRAEGSAEGTLFVDGQELASAREGEPVQVDPGEHVVTARRGDAVVLTEKVVLKEGETRELSLTIPEAGTEAPVAPGEDPGVSVPGAVLLGVGLASLVVGGVSIGVRQAAIGELDDACGEDSSCPPSAEEAYDRGRLATGLAEVFLPVGAVGVVVGAVLLATHGPDTPAPTEAARITGIGVLGPDGTMPGLIVSGAF